MTKHLLDTIHVKTGLAEIINEHPITNFLILCPGGYCEGIAHKELSALLARDQLVPIVHDTTYEALREVSPCSAREAV
jgi:hypothetical protein